MKLLYTSSLALVLGYAFAAPSGLESREPSNEPINVSRIENLPQSLNIY